MAYFSSAISVPGERVESLFVNGVLLRTTTSTVARITGTESRTGTVTPGWYKKTRTKVTLYRPVINHITSNSVVYYTRRSGKLVSRTRRHREVSIGTREVARYVTTRERLSEAEHAILSDKTNDVSFVRRNPLRLNTPENPFTYDLRRLRGANGWGRYGGSTSTLYMGELAGTGFQATASSFVFPQADVDALENLCVNKLLLKIKDQKVNVMQAFAELEQTAQLLGQTALRVLGMYRSLKRGDLAGAASSLGVHASKRAATRYRQTFSPGNLSQSIGRGVLELQYGWKPLLQDVYGSAEMVAQAQIREIRNRAKATSKRVYKVQRQDRSGSGLSSIVDTTRGTAFLEVSMRLQYATSSNALHTLGQLGFTNPALIAWELCPWSFVIDWFIPIGNYLSSLDATVGLSFVSGSKTTFARSFIARDVQWGGGSQAATQNYQTGQSASEVYDVHVTRTRLNSFPSSRPPAFKNPLSFTHAVNSIALLLGFKQRVR